MVTNKASGDGPRLVWQPFSEYLLVSWLRPLKALEIITLAQDWPVAHKIPSYILVCL